MIPGLQAVLPHVGSFFAEAGKRVLNRGIDTAADRGLSKLFPAEGPMTGAEQGAQMQDYMNKAFPGSTTSERLGVGNPMGGVSSGEVAARSAERLQRKELTSRERMQDKTNLKDILVATTPYGVAARESAMQAYAGGKGEHYETGLSQTREKLNAELPGIEAGSREKIARAIMEGDRAKLSKASAAAELNEKQWGVVGRIAASVAGTLGGAGLLMRSIKMKNRPVHIYKLGSSRRG